MSGQAGASALATYRSAKAARRRRAGLAVLLGAAAAFGWASRWPSGLDAAAAAGSGLAALAAGGASGGRDVARWRRGAQGERQTAEILAALPARRWAVWHDLRVPGTRSNLDHIVVGRTGVWVVDSKATRGRVRARRRSVRFGERRFDPSAVVWEAEAVASLLERRAPDIAGRAVRPLVVVHGAWEGRRRARVAGVRVAPADVVLQELRRGRRRLTRSEAKRVRDVLDAELAPWTSGTRRVPGRRLEGGPVS